MVPAEPLLVSRPNNIHFYSRLFFEKGWPYKRGSTVLVLTSLTTQIYLGVNWYWLAVFGVRSKLSAYCINSKQCLHSIVTHSDTTSSHKEVYMLHTFVMLLYPILFGRVCACTCICVLLPFWQFLRLFFIHGETFWHCAQNTFLPVLCCLFFLYAGQFFFLLVPPICLLLSTRCHMKLCFIFRRGHIIA